ncbi:hypothetical protein [Streptomyces sp. GS7]|uniref:hypothetical protein n=1 Tax=Streptomyces sp. GS7 TaxID=2692234 RepID=UPI001318C276|nr:hypothetical protein [Streptomyces sp. GS7]QHC23525.1 hypothetical protein GR130_21280 [Streptomyces sp. GS7]
MKVLLRLLVLAAFLFNLVSYFLWGGSLQALTSVGSGLICLAAAGGLWLLRSRRTAPSSSVAS